MSLIRTLFIITPIIFISMLDFIIPTLQMKQLSPETFRNWLKITEWGLTRIAALLPRAQFFSLHCVWVCLSLSSVWLFATPWTVAYQAPLSVGYSRKNTGVGCHFFLQGIFPTQGSNPCLLHSRQILHLLSHLRSLSLHYASTNQYKTEPCERRTFTR